MRLRQSHMAPCFTPTFLVVTDSNIIIVHYSFWNYYVGFNLWWLTGATFKTIVPFRAITSSTTRKGNILSTLEIKTKDIEYTDFKKDMVLINGLYTEQAEKVSKIIDLLMAAYAFPSPLKDPEKVTLEKAMEICRQKGTKIVWLGFETTDNVASVLSIPHNMLEHVTLSSFLSAPQEKLRRFHNSILLSYTTNSSIVVEKVLRLEAQLDCSVIDGGLLNNIPKGKIFVRDLGFGRMRR